MDYTVKKEGSGLYYFVLEGEIEVDGQQLRKRDGLGLWEVKMSTGRAISNAEVLLMEVPWVKIERSNDRGLMASR